MKRILITAIALLVAATAYSAGTVVVTGPENHGWNRHMKVVTFTCTADASDGTYPATNINADNTGMLSTLEGYWLSHIKVTPGGTGPTDNSDLTLTVNSTDILGGNGADIVDNATGGYCVPYGSNGDAQYPMTGNNLTLNLSNNSVNSAVVTVVLVFER